ncbi:hypothetical protein [Nocardioides sp. SYSU DS0663]|uniref:hypothetical protein n=1 Tax=Nocardioides sp. SYSU DS0663 TaxID=3416445 RepID=UPI003F4B43E5
MTTTSAVPLRRNLPLITARTLFALLGSVQAVGATMFLLVAPENAVWVGPWLDVPVVAWTLTQIALHLAVGFAPRLSVARRTTIGIVAVAMGTLLTPVKVWAYDEPEAVTFLLVDAVLLVLLLLARRHGRDR